MPFLKCHLYKRPRDRLLEDSTLKQGWHRLVNRHPSATYNGDWKDNHPCGFGVFVTDNKEAKKEGRWDIQYGLRDGVSCFGSGSGAYELEYRGEWKKNHYSGKGELHYRDGSFYQGCFRLSKRHGYGEMWYQDGSYYSGNWHKDLRTGFSMFVECNGNRYEGMWANDKKHGQGRYFLLATGQFMDGRWENDVCKTGLMADIPFRQTSNYPTPYTIDELVTRENIWQLSNASSLNMDDMLEVMFFDANDPQTVAQSFRDSLK